LFGLEDVTEECAGSIQKTLPTFFHDFRVRRRLQQSARPGLRQEKAVT
jgi:hypothetical protein